MKKKIVSLALGAVLSMTLLTGCGKAKDDNPLIFQWAICLWAWKIMPTAF